MEIFHLPFQEDYERIPIAQDKLDLNADLKKKIDTVPVVASILQQFFKKAIQSQNLLDDNLNFDSEFKEMKKFNDQEDVYSK